MVYPIAIVCVLLAISSYPLAFVPLGVLAPGFANTMFGLNARDGLLVMFEFLLATSSGQLGCFKRLAS